jgi:hypothetical protein
MAGLRPPPVTQNLVRFFTSAELARLEHACVGRSFAQRRDASRFPTSYDRAGDPWRRDPPVRAGGHPL